MNEQKEIKSLPHIMQYEKNGYIKKKPLAENTLESFYIFPDFSGSDLIVDVKKQAEAYLQTRENVGKIHILEEGQSLQYVIDNSNPMDIIALPAATIIVNELFIRKPIILLGNSQSRLKVVNGQIIIDTAVFEEFSGIKKSQLELGQQDMLKKEYTFEFVELNILYAINSTIKNDKSCVVDSFKNIPASQLENQDIKEDPFFMDHFVSDKRNLSQQCNLQSFIYYSSIYDVNFGDCTFSMVEESELPHKIGSSSIFFYFAEPSGKDKQKALKRPLGNISVLSCVFKNFHTLISCKRRSNVTLEKSLLMDFSGYGLNLKNMGHVNVSECVFKDCQKTAVNILCTEKCNEIISIRLIKNSIQSFSNGISIMGKELIDSSFNIELDHNGVAHCGKFGIVISSLICSNITISYNAVNFNAKSGILLQSIFCYKETNMLNNVTMSNGENGITLIDVLCKISACEIIENKNLGIKFSMRQEISDPALRLILKDCILKKNANAGIYLEGVFSKPILVIDCKLFGNNAGIHIKQTNISLPAIEQPTKKNTGPDTFSVYVLCENGETIDHHYGIFVESICVPLIIQKFKYSDHNRYGIFCQTSLQFNYIHVLQNYAEIKSQSYGNSDGSAFKFSSQEKMCSRQYLNII